MIVQYTKSFDRSYAALPKYLRDASKETIALFLKHYASRDFPKGLRLHKAGPFLSLSVTMNYRIFVSPIPGGLRFVFIGDHKDADNYLKR